MKLDDKQNNASLKEQVYNADWAKEIATQFHEHIPLIMDIPKGMNSKDIHCRVPAFIGEMVEKISYKKEGKFESPSEVIRAAIYIGMNVLYHLIELQGFQSTELKTIFSRMKSSEEVMTYHLLVKEATKAISYLKEAADSGVISFEDRDCQIDGIIKDMPNNLQRITKKKAIQLLAGEKLSSISEFKTHGGKRAKGEE